VLSEQYFKMIQAPFKELFWFENSSHLPNTEEPRLFHKILVDKVLPTIKEDA
jgi:proline iminopeptidase